MNAPKLPHPELEKEARTLALLAVAEMDRCDVSQAEKQFMRLLDDPDRQATFAANLFAVGTMTKILKGDIDNSVFELIMQLCRCVVARKHKLIAIKPEVEPEKGWTYARN